MKPESNKLTIAADIGQRQIINYYRKRYTPTTSKKEYLQT